MKMRICFIIPNLGDGGAQRQCIALLNALQLVSDADLHLIVFAPGAHDEDLEASRLSVHRISVRNFADPRVLVFIVRTLRRVKPDLVMSWLHPADILTYLATRIVRIPWVMTERDSAYPDDFVYSVRKHVGRKADLITANSSQGAAMWAQLNPRGQILYIPNMLLQESSHEASANAANSPASETCLYVGRLEPQKNIRRMVAVFSNFAAYNSRAHMDIVGMGTEHDAVLRSIVVFGLEDRIELLGFQKGVFDIMKRARLLISFSRHEGMPNVLMEAVAADLLAVVSDIPEHRALLGDQYPFLVPLSVSDADAAAALEEAWQAADSRQVDYYGFARDVLATMTPELVTRSYVSAFRLATKACPTRSIHREERHS